MNHYLFLALDNMASLTKMLYSIDIMATVNIWKAFKR